MKILALDIETRPSLAYVWSLWDDSVPLQRLIEEGEIICFAAKFLDEKKMHFHSVQKDGVGPMLDRAWELLDEADFVIHYNGSRFDIPHLNKAFLLRGYEPPSPYKQVDLFKTVKLRFKFVSNKLEHVARALGLKGKTEHEGFGLWIKCMAGDTTAWKKMEKYNKQDVVLVEELYNKLKLWSPGMPNLNLYEGGNACPLCGDSKMQRRGFYYTELSAYQKWQCLSCGKYSRSKKLVQSVDLRPVAVN